MAELILLICKEVICYIIAIFLATIFYLTLFSGETLTGSCNTRETGGVRVSPEEEANIAADNQ